MRAAHSAHLEDKVHAGSVERIGHDTCHMTEVVLFLYPFSSELTAVASLLLGFSHASIAGLAMLNRIQSRLSMCKTAVHYNSSAIELQQFSIQYYRCCTVK